MNLEEEHTLIIYRGNQHTYGRSLGIYGWNYDSVFKRNFTLEVNLDSWAHFRSSQDLF